MPRGDNPNSRKNLIKPKRDLTAEEQRIRASKAGKKSGEVRKAYASLTEALKDQLTPDVLKDLTAMLIDQARSGNMKAYELLRDQAGEKPVDRINISQVDPDTVSELKTAINKRNIENEKHSELSGN